MRCMRLAENTGRKNRYLGTIVQICQAISSQVRHVASEKKLVKQHLRHMSSQYGELQPTSGSDHFVSLGHPSKFQRVSRLGSVTARHSTSGRQPNCGIEQRAPPAFGRAAITLGIGPHFQLQFIIRQVCNDWCYLCSVILFFIIIYSVSLVYEVYGSNSTCNSSV